MQGFALDDVPPSTDNLTFLLNRFGLIELYDRRNLMPSFPFCRTPWYWLIGRKPVDPAGA